MSPLSDLSTLKHAPGQICVEGAFIDDFDIVGDMPPEQVPAAIERDRPYFVGRPGFYRKLLPVLMGEKAVQTGGRYLFETRADAEAFGRWLTREFRLDGSLFVDRPWIKNLSGNAYDVIGAHDFKDVHSAQTVVRAERWTLEPGHGADLVRTWSAIREAAAASDLATVWLLFADDRNEAVLVSAIDRVAPADPNAPDVASLRALATRASLAEPFDHQPWSRKTFDRTSWIFTLWFAPTHRPLHLWPNSPPFPGLDSPAPEATSSEAARPTTN